MAFDKKEYDRKYNQAHKKEYNEWRRKYRKEHKTELAEQRKKYRQKNKKKIAKQRYGYNLKHKEEIAKYCRERYVKISNWYYNNIKELSCFDCGYSFWDKPYMADFHHLHGKDGRSGMLGFITHCSYDRVIEELSGGVYICPNCHRERHPERWRSLCR